MGEPCEQASNTTARMPIPLTMKDCNKQKRDRVLHSRVMLHAALPRQWAQEPCLDLINTRFNDHLGSGSVNDRLPMTEWRRAFLKRWHYPVPDPDDPRGIARLAELRQVLRLALERYAESGQLKSSVRRQLEAEMNRAGLSVRIVGRPGAEALKVERNGSPWDVVTADIATSAMRLIGERRIVKVCANPDCSWMFEDLSKSGSRRWCDVSVCGSLINVRRHRQTAR